MVKSDSRVVCRAKVLDSVLMPPSAIRIVDSFRLAPSGSILPRAGRMASIMASDCQRRPQMLTEVNHIGIVVSDIDASLAFYRDELGGEIIFQKPRLDGTALITYLRVGDGYVELLLS